ncbi:sigma factor-like helix-turn-helix DNA-binding protein [Micromonospora sp. NPDC050686]|uniref:sigma factor-like helix-turn-helix DNA-binding protein n=1 Tax=Micromonospora sp. NPDC050686 TaxID=3154631 RepID=UPI0033D45EE3
MTDDLVVTSRPAECWLDAFPWLEAVAAKDGPAGPLSPWWRQPIDPPGSEYRRRQLAQISDLALERLGRWTIGQIFPGLPAETWLEGLPLTTRARNALGRFGYRTASDLQGIELTDILDWHQVGAGTVDCILQALADAATGTAAPLLLPVGGPDAPTHGASAARSAVPPTWTMSLIEDIQLVASWLVALGVPEESLLGTALRAGTPPEIAKARQRIERLSAGEVLDDEQVGLDAAELLEREITALDGRAQEILARRFFADAPETLDELGRAMGVTRERVRQIEAKARANMVEALQPSKPLELIGAAARELIGTVLPLNSLLDLLPALARTVDSVQQPAWRVLDRLDDAYEIEDGWCVSPTMVAAQTTTQTRLLELANPHGVVRLIDIDELNPNVPADSQQDALVAWLRHCGYTVDGEHVLTRTQSVGDWAGAILSIVGSPMSSQELLDRFAVRRSVGSLRNAMSIDERFERVDRDRWALAEWGFASYTGIRALVREEVARAGGQVPMETLIERITGTYSVTANSVVAYASAAPFESRNGIVRLAGSDPSIRKTPERTRRLYRRGSRWLYRIRVTKDHLRGSGSVAPMAIASILGLQFGQTRLLETPLGPQSINWTGNQPAFGTIRRFLVADDIETDGDLFLVIGDDGTFGIEPVRPLTGDSLGDALALVGAKEGSERPRATLAVAIGLPAESPVSSVIGGYRERGDTEVADLLVRARTALEDGVAPSRQVRAAEINDILDLL